MWDLSCCSLIEGLARGRNSLDMGVLRLVRTSAGENTETRPAQLRWKCIRKRAAAGPREGAVGRALALPAEPLSTAGCAAPSSPLPVSEGDTSRHSGNHLPGYRGDPGCRLCMWEAQI